MSFTCNTFWCNGQGCHIPVVSRGLIQFHRRPKYSPVKPNCSKDNNHCFRTKDPLLTKSWVLSFQNMLKLFTVVLSKFASQRPPNVLSITPYDQEVFVCKCNENIRLLGGLHKVLPSAPRKPKDSSTCVFYEPVSLRGNGPVEIDETEAISSKIHHHKDSLAFYILCI